MTSQEVFVDTTFNWDLQVPTSTDKYLKINTYNYLKIRRGTREVPQSTHILHSNARYFEAIVGATSASKYQQVPTSISK